jgi:SAM-dependent methyltransferase
VQAATFVSAPCLTCAPYAEGSEPALHSEWEAEIESKGVSQGDRDPLGGSSWSRPDTVAGFAQSAPNQALMQFAADERSGGARRVLDLGCGAGRNTVPLARLGWSAIGIDMSLAMIAAAAARVREEHIESHIRLVLASMHELPFAARTFDFIVAHGIWNLARSGGEFRRALGEAARVARPGSALFVFTFSRNTLPADAQPVPDESFVFTQFSGEPQCFLTADQLATELEASGFVADPSASLRELNLPQPGALYRSGGPVIYEGIFRRARG